MLARFLVLILAAFPRATAFQDFYAELAKMPAEGGVVAPHVDTLNLRQSKVLTPEKPHDPVLDQVAFSGVFGDNVVLQRAPLQASLAGSAPPGEPSSNVC
eukprot:637621-Prorocentrum_minimum.AAC.2